MSGFKVIHGHRPWRGRTTPEYEAWKNMRQRCNNSARSDYKHYGGRGIKVCERWNDFRLFFQDMGERPSDCKSIDRIDNSKGYEPGNCKWVTGQRVQCANMRKNIRVVVGGKIMIAKQAAAMLGLKYSRIIDRRYHGWSIERAFDGLAKEAP